ncbi:MAG: PQQ-binding-like beta-propeller repeat protein, partial [Nitrososphaerales archaeon]
ANIGNERRKVVIAGSKTDFLYVLDAANGEPVYDPIKLGQPSFNVPNDNAGNNADLTISQRTLVGKIFCPGGNGGMEHPPAFADNTIYIATQRVCWTLVEGPVNYKGRDMDGFIYGASTGERQNSTLYAIDVSDGSIKWTFEMPNRYQSAGIMVSGGVVYAVDRASVWYALDQETGTMLRRSQFGGLGAGTVTVGATARGEMMLFLPAGGGQVAANTPGILVAFGLPEGTSGNSGPNIIGSPIELVSIAVAAIAAIVAVFVVLRSRRR